MSGFSKKIALLIGLLGVIFFVGIDVPNADAVAQEPGRTTQMMVGVPGLDAQAIDRTLPEYINAIYLFLITAGAVFGVIKIAIAGFKYAASDIISSKAEAKKDIGGVLLGLLILLSPYIILTYIDRSTVNLEVLKLNPLGGAGGLDGIVNNNIAPSNSQIRDQIIRENTNRCGTYDLRQRPRRPASSNYTVFEAWCGGVGGTVVPRPGAERYNDCLALPTVACPTNPNWPPRN